MNQQQLMLVILVVAVVLALAVVVAAAVTIRDRRSYRLRPRYGPEYDRTVRDAGDVRRAEATRLHITPLTAEQTRRFSDEWQQVQARFVDEPAGAVLQADRLIGDIMQARGYPVGDFEQRVEDISVDHPDIVMNYRAARLDKRRRAMLDFAVKLTVEPWAIEEGDRAPLAAAGFSERDIWDIAAVASFYNMTNRLASATDMRPNEGYHGMAR